MNTTNELRAPDTAAAVITYFPEPDFCERLAAIVREFSNVLVVDNSGDAGVADRLRTACTTHGAELILNSKNRGLGAALNQAFALFAERGLKWVVTFDQDSTPTENFATALRAARDASRDCAVIGANWHDLGRPNFASRHLRPCRHFPIAFRRMPATGTLDDVTCVITSGSMFNVAGWREIGRFDENLFVDLVDTDYCLRARTAGHRIAVAADARLAHRRGAKRAVRLLGRTWWPAFTPAWRLQLLYRNRVLLLRRYAWRYPHWAVFELAHAAKVAAEVSLLENDKLTKLRACIRGTLSGLLNRPFTANS